LVGLEYENRYINAKMRLGKLAWSCMGSVRFQLDRPLEDRGLLDELGGRKGGLEIVRLVWEFMIYVSRGSLVLTINNEEYFILEKTRYLSLKFEFRSQYDSI